MEKPSTWYVYTYAFPDDTVFYVGKGTGSRINAHEDEASKECPCKKCMTIREVWASGNPVKKRIVFETLDEEEALAKEHELIQLYAGDCLTNISMYIASKPSKNVQPRDINKRDIRFGKDGIERLERLAVQGNKSPAEVAREALIAYEINQSLFRDTVRDAVLGLIRACTPDELYDPADDPRQEEAVKRLGELLGSYYAAEGVQLAIVQTIAQGLSSMANRSEHYE